MSYEYIKFGPEEKEFISKIEEISGQNIYSCYQCGKCSAGCAFSSRMDKTVNQIIHFIQMGQKDKVLQANTHWICSSCLTCSIRCPREIDVAALMEAVREYILREEPEKVKIADLPKEVIEKLPNIALVGNFRKMTG
ncbi:MAG: 4Fe-4S dicluster domain-containing protein [Candidatus Heimdallarchaeota archaeon]|nr:4Fe-4S dicluster domain-containing protein [Candidatus Heimdallarchaeota archaeon]MCK4954628.1 4Fe-4S dicluster domain-containing protein [Candidatus Heimdallarchaeota archaeon]